MTGLRVNSLLLASAPALTSCVSTPGTGFLYNVDSFAMFGVDGADKKEGQDLS